MPFFRQPNIWDTAKAAVTPEHVFLNRRQFIRGSIAGGMGLALLSLTGCQKASSSAPDLGNDPLAGTQPLRFGATDLNLPDPGRTTTPRDLTARYNNFYEFGGNKNIWRAAQSLPTENWQVRVHGLIDNPKTYDIDDFTRLFGLEERLYRFRCVEAWAMTVPWVGFPMRKLLEASDPQSSAKFVKFTSFYDERITTGPGWRPGSLPWPYQEGLRIEEMANELAFFATGAYGHSLPKQNGAPIRMVVPWKYGFKGAKSIVDIEFTAEQPATYWNTLGPTEYKFEANVEPQVPHPRWSQAEERVIDSGNPSSWNVEPTLLYNGYGEFVADLYA
ncbi:MAG: protein-methionine-sulfoxide reductase catalytic subunit MsrP [Geitlerinemataceae cyanobacterium]